MSFQRLQAGAVPALFVVLWSSGFIGGKLGLPYAEPFTFLGLRFVAVIALLGAVAVLTRAPWPANRRMAWHFAVSGILVHGVYLGGVFSAIRHGLPAGVVALIVGLQPVLTAAAVGPLLGERVTARQWLGLVLGLAGVAMVLSSKLDSGVGGFAWDAPVFALLALLGITAGTLHQKKYCSGMDLRTGTLIQYAAALAVTAPLALGTETMEVEWTGEFLFALAWLVLVLSVGAISLLMLMIRRGEASRVAGLFYLTPPTTALMAWALFGETLTPVALAGMAVAAAGVALVVAPRR